MPPDVSFSDTSDGILFYLIFARSSHTGTSIPAIFEVNAVPSFFSKCSHARSTYRKPMYCSGRLQYTIRIFAKSLRSHRALRSIPAMFVITPKEMTIRQRTRIILINAGLVEIRFAHISVNDKKPKRQVKANRPKQTLTSIVTK